MSLGSFATEVFTAMVTYAMLLLLVYAVVHSVAAAVCIYGEDNKPTLPQLETRARAFQRLRAQHAMNVD